jgi:DNA-binding SARP family transcriptional activator
MLRVRLLGQLGVEDDDGAVRAPASRPARELLAWLALHPGMHPRLELASRFWPDVLESSARASLRTALHELRRDLGDVVAAGRETVGLAGEPWVDALAVRALPPEEALALCAGDALPGLDRDWAIAERDAHRELVAGLLTQLAGAAEGEAALRWARELVRVDPSSEDGTRRLMRVLADTGDRAAALTAYTRLEERLRRDLRVAPSRRTRELAAAIRAEDVDAAAPLPRVLSPRGPFAGRDEELRRVRAVTGRGLVAVAGEPGIGKTRLLAELARGHGGPVRYGACHEDALVPYEPFVEALGEVMPEAGEEGGRWRLFEGIGERLEGALVLIDDVHWADTGTLRLLEHLLRREEPPALVVAYREGDVSHGHPLAVLLADLRAGGLLERITLHGLDEPAVAELAGGAGAADLRRATGGNPFFIEQVVRHRADGGDPAAVPEGVKEVLGRRLARLAPGTGTVLAHASAAGLEFDVALLEAVLEDDDVLGALEEAEQRQLVRERAPGRYGFAHALVCEAVYEGLGLTRRRRIHAALAAALPPGRAAELAHHRLLAGDAEAAGGAVLDAAREAVRAFAYEDAARLCERALALGGPRRDELLLALGDARLRAGGQEAAREAFRAVEGGPELRARAALGYSGLGVTIIAVDREAVTRLEAAVAALAADDPLRGRLLARLAIETYYDRTPAERKALVDEAIAAGGAGPETLNALHAALWSPQYLAERLATAERMIVEAPDAETELQGRNWRVVDLMEASRLDEARAEIEAHEQLAARLRLPAYEWWGPMWRSSLALLEGRRDEAQALIERFRRIDDPNARLYAEIQTYGIAFLDGDVSGMVEATMAREDGRPAEYAYRAGYSWMLALAGRHDEAREQVARSAAGMREDMNQLAALAELAQALDILREPGPAVRLYDALLPYADRNIVNARGAAGYGSASRHLGLLARLLGRDPEPHFAAARRHNERLGARRWL